MIKSGFTRVSYGDPRKAVDKAVVKSSLALGTAIAAQAKLLAPVDEGQLRNSLSASNLRDTKLLNTQPGEQAEPLDTKGLKDDQVYVGSNSDHAVFQEYGTRFQPAQSYLRPAAELITGQNSIEGIFKKYGAEEMNRELKKRRKK
jgi:HK97 gp10 family phage protein